MKQKAFFVIFEGLSLKQIKKFGGEGESSTLKVLISRVKNFIFLLKQLFGCPRASFKLFVSRQPLPPIVNHCAGQLLS